ncbi:MAG: hypothetical protein WAT22_17500 [Saprospiraceae bacterium]
MIDINKILYNANLYSIEFSGFISLKFTLTDESTLNNICDDVTLEFINGAILIDNNGKKVESIQNIFYLFGSSIKYSALLNNGIEIEFDNGFKIKSENPNVEDELLDRNWVLSETVSGNYIIFNDTNNIVVSEVFKEFVLK